MTYYVTVEVTKEFESEKEAEEFADKVIEPIKGVDYTKKIRYYKPKNYSSGMRPYTYTFNTNTTNFSNVPKDSESVQKRLTKLANMGMLKEGHDDGSD